MSYLLVNINIVANNNNVSRGRINKINDAFPFQYEASRTTFAKYRMSYARISLARIDTWWFTVTRTKRARSSKSTQIGANLSHKSNG